MTWLVFPAKNPGAYPRRGTPMGDEILGQCEGACKQPLRRGDNFVTILDKRLLCRPCYETEK